MPDRYMRHLAALGGLAAALLLAGGASLAQEIHKAPNKQQAAAHERAEPKSDANAPDVRIARRQEISAQKAASTQSSKDGVELGSWPDWVIVGFTLVLTLVAILQHRLESAMSRDTGDSIQIARDSANAAKRLASEIEASNRIALRAYISLQAAQVLNIGEGQKPKFVGELKNFGRTPAKNVRARHNVWACDFPLPIAIPDSVPVAGQGSTGVVAAGSEIKIEVEGTGPLSTDQIARIKAGRGVILGFGEIHYDDVFNGHQITRYRFMWGGDAGAPDEGQMAACHEGNEAT